LSLDREILENEHREDDNQRAREICKSHTDERLNKKLPDLAFASARTTAQVFGR